MAGTVFLKVRLEFYSMREMMENREEGRESEGPDSDTKDNGAEQGGAFRAGRGGDGTGD